MPIRNVCAPTRPGHFRRSADVGAIGTFDGARPGRSRSAGSAARARGGPGRALASASVASHAAAPVSQRTVCPLLPRNARASASNALVSSAVPGAAGAAITPPGESSASRAL